LEAQTGCSVRTAMIVGGASANTINKLAAGISDNLALRGFPGVARCVDLPRVHRQGRTRLP
jgi:hypothetical protein